MVFTFNYQGIHYSFDSTKPLDISLPLKDGSNNPNCYYADPVLFETIRAGNFIGNVSEGGPVNHKKIQFSPHGNGTHTECFGHISAEPSGKINKCLTEFLFLALLVSVSPQINNTGDKVITVESLKQCTSTHLPEALIMRTLPNEYSKTTRQYSGTNPVYIDPALCAYLAAQDVKHLLIDLPSVDKEVDGGLLTAHKLFWQYPDNIRRECTITELAFIPDIIKDGIYLLNLQISSFELDVSPSKPILYMLQKQV